MKINSKFQVLKCQKRSKTNITKPPLILASQIIELAIEPYLGKEITRNDEYELLLDLIVAVIEANLNTNGTLEDPPCLVCGAYNGHDDGCEG